MTRTTNHNDDATNLMRSLRDFTPRRPLRVGEAKRLAERQANHFRKLTGDAGPRFCMGHIERVPRIDVLHHDQISVSGVTQWRNGAWRLHINSSEPSTRQRFTLAHEFKHVLDAGVMNRAYKWIIDRIDGHHQIEQICNHFAACLLMPKKWITKLWKRGVRSIDQLADAFDVSQAAMRYRLQDVGLLPATRFEYAAIQIYDHPSLSQRREQGGRP